jgi:hypothetical protein
LLKLGDLFKAGIFQQIDPAPGTVKKKIRENNKITDASSVCVGKFKPSLEAPS